MSGTVGTPQTSSSTRSSGGGLRVTRWVLVIVGGISTFIGGFILLGGEDQYVGVGGDVSWRVGDVDPLWGWGLLLGGAALLAAGVVAFVTGRGRANPPGASSSRTDLIAHTTAFVIVNAFVWIQDIALGDGVNYAWWVTIPWGIGLAAHAIAYRAGERG